MKKQRGRLYKMVCPLVFNNALVSDGYYARSYDPRRTDS